MLGVSDEVLSDGDLDLPMPGHGEAKDGEGDEEVGSRVAPEQESGGLLRHRQHPA